MSFPTIGDLRGLPDPLLSYRWTLIIANVPGGGDGRRLQYQCHTSSIPGLSNDTQVVSSHGIDLKFAGRPQFGQSISCTFFETRDMIIYRTLRKWQKFSRNAIKGTGNYKEDYAVIANLLLFDDTLKVVQTIQLDGFFPHDLSETGLDGTSSAPVNFTCTFNFDTSDEL